MAADDDDGDEPAGGREHDHDHDRDHDHGHDHGPGHGHGQGEGGDEPDPHEDMEIASQALAAGDLSHAARHVADALAVHPEREDWRAVLDAIADRAAGASPGPEESSEGPPLRDGAATADALFPVDGGMWFGHAAGRAHVLRRRGEPGQAVGLLAQVVAAMPGRGYEAWLAEWVAGQDGPPEGGLLSALAEVLGPTIGFLRLRESERRACALWLPIVRALVRRPGLPPPVLAFTSGLFRRCGELEEAEAVARGALAAQESDMAATALGLALRARGAWDEALEAFELARRLDPQIPADAERARVLVDAGRLSEAEQALERVELERDPELQLMTAWVRLRLRGDARPRRLLDRFRGRTRIDPALVTLARGLGERASADTFRSLTRHAVGYLPVPGDATANVVRQVWTQSGAQGGSKLTRMSVTSLEGPSNRLALALLCGSDDPGAVPYEFGAVPTPDPRRPRRPVRDVLWIYQGPEQREVTRAAARPGERVQRVVSAIATSTYFLPRWWDAARSAGPSLGPTLAEDLLGAMVHPPPLPPGSALDPVEWIFRHQLAAALVLAHVDEGWERSRRREALLSLVDGAMDWTVDAAILALRELALDEPEVLPEVEQRLWELLREVPKPGHEWFAPTLCWSYLALPGSPRDRRLAMQHELEELSGEGEDEEQT